MEVVSGGAGKLLCLRRDEKAAAMFLFERAQAAKGKNREARPGGIFRQGNDRRGIPPPRPFNKALLTKCFFHGMFFPFLVGILYIFLSS